MNIEIKENYNNTILILNNFEKKFKELIKKEIEKKYRKLVLEKEEKLEIIGQKISKKEIEQIIKDLISFWSL